MIILEEASMAATYGLISANDLLDMISSKPENMELVIKGNIFQIS
jgi:ATP:corrinoid adenosyltransferase